jgi:hypothetical protein
LPLGTTFHGFSTSSLRFRHQWSGKFESGPVRHAAYGPGPNQIARLTREKDASLAFPLFREGAKGTAEARSKHSAEFTDVNKSNLRYRSVAKLTICRAKNSDPRSPITIDECVEFGTMIGPMPCADMAAREAK